MTLPGCPRCAAAVEPDWDWCQQCGYDPESLRPVGVPIGAMAGGGSPPEPAGRDGARRSRTRKRSSVAVAAPPIVVVDPPPLAPPKPTETVYGLLPYDHPSSVAPVEPEEPDHEELVNRRFAIVALGVIVVGLALLITMLVLG